MGTKGKLSPLWSLPYRPQNHSGCWDSRAPSLNSLLFSFLSLTPHLHQSSVEWLWLSFWNISVSFSLLSSLQLKLRFCCLGYCSGLQTDLNFRFSPFQCVFWTATIFFKNVDLIVTSCKMFSNCSRQIDQSPYFLDGIKSSRIGN